MGTGTAKRLTRAQAAALQLIRDNPGRVIARRRGQDGYLTIHGNVERALYNACMITAVEVGGVEVWTIEDDPASVAAPPMPAPAAQVPGATYSVLYRHTREYGYATLTYEAGLTYEQAQAAAQDATARGLVPWIAIESIPEPAPASGTAPTFRTREEAVAESMAHFWGQEWAELPPAGKYVVIDDYIVAEDDDPDFDMPTYRSLIHAGSLASYADGLAAQSDRAAAGSACRVMRHHPGMAFRDEAGRTFRWSGRWTVDGTRMAGPIPRGVLCPVQPLYLGVQPVECLRPAGGILPGDAFVAVATPAGERVVWLVHERRVYTDGDGHRQVEFRCEALADLHGWPRREWATLTYLAGDVLEQVTAPVQHYRPRPEAGDEYGMFEISTGYAGTLRRGDFVLIAEAGKPELHQQVWRVREAGAPLALVRVADRDGNPLPPVGLDYPAGPGEEMVIVGHARIRYPDLH